MSCGTIDSHTLKSAIDYAISKEVVIVAAIGNDGSSRYNYPAAYDNVIGVRAANEAPSLSASHIPLLIKFYNSFFGRYI